ncbi:flippase-like domain-containing protein [Patescibacteria group bacterium]|nr:flippase-like domain-containing protein [Patescibacteria group bacterium]
MKEKMKTVLKIVISLSLIIYLFSTKVDKAELIENFKILNWRFLPLIFLTIVVHYVISSFRWKSLLIHENSDKVSRVYLFKLYFIGAFFNNFMPTSIGGDVYKMYRLGKKIGDQATGFSSVFTERFTGIVTLFLIGLFSVGKNLGPGVWVLLIWFISGFFVAIKMLEIFSTKVSFLKKIYDALMVYKAHPKVLAYAMITSLLIQALSITTQYLTFMSVGIRLPILYSLVAFPVITLAGFFVPSINGLGVQDALYATMFSFVGVSVSAAISVSIIYHMVRMGTSLIGGVLYGVGKDS